MNDRSLEQQKAWLSISEIDHLKDLGFSQSDIARSTGYTRQYISWIKMTYGGRMTPREAVRRDFPWTPTNGQSQASPCKRMRDHGEYIATGGDGMSQDKLQRLRVFYRKLKDENVVVEFDPDIPPTPGVSSNGGWAFRPRLPEDGDLLIRVNEHTRLTEEGRRIWRFPTVEP